MHHNSEAFEKFQKYKVEVEKQLGIYIKQFSLTEAVNLES